MSVRAEREGTHVRLAIADRGPGIPQGHEERIFERFYRIDAGRSRDRGRLAASASRSSRARSRRWAAGCGSSTATPGARFVIELDAA